MVRPLCAALHIRTVEGDVLELLIHVVFGLVEEVRRRRGTALAAGQEAVGEGLLSATGPFSTKLLSWAKGP